MRASILPWLFPIALLVTVVLVSVVPGPFDLLAVVAWGWILFPAAIALIRPGSGSRQGDVPETFGELQSRYLRM